MRARVAAAGLAFAGTVLLGVGAGLTASATSPRTVLWLGVAAMTVFLLAAGLSRGSGLRAATLAGAALSAVVVAVGVWRATERSGPRVLLLLVPVGLLVATAAVAWRDARRTRLRALRSRLDGEEAERRRWVRELHDDTLQGLAGIQVLLGTAGTNPAAVATARDALTGQIRGLRRLIAQLRPLALDTLGLAAALEDLAVGAREATGIDVTVRVADLPRLPGETETSIYRIGQEALTNAVRHAKASRVTIEAYPHGRWLTLAVRDDGVGRPDGFVAGHGLLGMRERAEALGARLRIAPASPAGTVVSLEVPR
jgi:signal transduction histidine kinase